MKKIISVFLVISAIVVLSGCSFSTKHTRESSLNTAEDGRVSFSGETSTIWNKDPGPEELARAALIKKMSEAYARGESVKAEGWYIVGFRNNSRKNPIYVPHPELSGSTLEVLPGGGFAFMQIMHLPRFILVYDWRGRLKEKANIKESWLKDKKVVDGLEVDVLFTYSD